MCAHFLQCWQFTNVKVSHNVVHAHFALYHQLQICLDSQNDNCAGVSDVSAVLQNIFTFPVQLLEELRHSELYHLV